MSNYTCKHDYVSVPPDKHDCPECLAPNKPAQSDAPSAEAVAIHNELCRELGFIPDLHSRREAAIWKLLCGESAKVAQLERERQEFVSFLEILNARGGLGSDVHKRIADLLAGASGAAGKGGTNGK